MHKISSEIRALNAINKIYIEIHNLLCIYNIMIYNRIKTLRTEKGLSRKELADAVGVNFQTIGYLERGDYNASLELAFKLAEYFEVPLDMAFSPRPFKSMAEQLAELRAAE